MSMGTVEGGEGSILLVEDEEMARSSLSRMLAMKFPASRLYTAENGRSGLELFLSHRPQVVITDINMPQLSGIEMARAIRDESHEVQIVVLSAHSELAYLQAVVAMGENTHYLLKPTDRNELFAVVGRCLASNA